MMASKKNNSDKEEKLPTASSLTPGEKSIFSAPVPKIEGYHIISTLGEGVYLAEQQRPVKRRVALKVIKPGMDSKQVIARFEAEEQALALLDHPNIAGVYEAGMSESGQSYFAMEYVKGVRITEHCDRNKLSIEERLKIFLQVCDAIGHAHQKGIIHRDIKPSNILVFTEGENIIPKVIDFGVAKAISQPLTERTLFTEQGQLIGTPEYMSPEQAEMAGQDIDTRTDIYSLGVLLYELLTGALPFEPKTLREAAFAEIQRIIREQDPPRPSTRLTSLGEEAKKVAESRRTAVATLAKRLHKELEWIPLKAMRKERAHRYRSASELADDIQNYLDGAPLIAGPESAAYRIKKFVRRHRLQLATICIIVGMLIGIPILITTINKSVTAKTIRRLKVEATDWLQKGYYKKAEEAFAKILGLDERNIDARQGIPEARDQQELVRDLELAQQHLNESRYDLALGLALSAQERFPRDPRVLKMVRLAKGTATVSVKFDLGTITKATLRKIAEEADESSTTLPLGELLSPGGVDIDPGWYWLKLFYAPNPAEATAAEAIKKYLLFIQRGIPYSLHVRKVIVGDHPEANFASLEEALLLCQPGNILSLAPGEHELNNIIQVSNLSVESKDPGEPASIALSGLRINGTWDVKLLYLKFHAVESGPGNLNFKDSVFCQIIECAFQRNSIDAENCDLMDINSNSFVGNNHHISAITNSHRIFLRNNSANNGNGFRTFVFDNCTEMIILNNKVKRCGLIGLCFSNCDDILISGNTLSQNYEGEIRLNYCGEVALAFNNCNSNRQYGVFLSRDSFAASNVHTFRPSGIGGVAIQHNNINGGKAALLLEAAYNIIYRNNVIANADVGMLFQSGGGHWVEKNIFTKNKRTVVGNKDYWAGGTFTNNLIDCKISNNDLGNARLDITDNVFCQFELGEAEEGFCRFPLKIRGDPNVLGLQAHTYGPALSLRNHYLDICNDIADMVVSFDTANFDFSLDVELGEPLRSRTLGFAKKVAQRGPPIVNTKNFDLFSSQRAGLQELKENPGKVPPQARLFDNHHYLFSMLPMNWRDAKRYCESVGGHLVTITSSAEDYWIRETFPPSWNFWLGGTDEAIEGQWQWITDEEWQYSQWDHTQPDNAQESEHALHIWEGGRWNDEKMDKVKPFLIEWDR
jgi:parallel beta-helix repeat protein